MEAASSPRNAHFGIGVPQPLQRPRKARKLTQGISSAAVNTRPQAVQWLRPFTIPSPRGSRSATTPKKLKMQAPKRNLISQRIPSKITNSVISNVLLFPAGLLSCSAFHNCIKICSVRFPHFYRSVSSSPIISRSWYTVYTWVLRSYQTVYSFS